LRSLGENAYQHPSWLSPHAPANVQSNDDMILAPDRINLYYSSSNRN
jgi:hypothetical protein